MAKQFIGVGELNPANTTGTWTRVTASNVTTYNKTVADDTTTVDFEVPALPGMFALDRQPVKAIEVQYSVATAALDAAPTAVLNKITIDPATGVITRAAVTQTLTFKGTNTVGTAAGTYFAVITPSAPISPNAGETYTVEVTFNAGLTTVLKVGGINLETA